MNYVSILNQLLENKIIAILRLDSPQKVAGKYAFLSS